MQCEGFQGKIYQTVKSIAGPEPRAFGGLPIAKDGFGAAFSRLSRDSELLASMSACIRSISKSSDAVVIELLSDDVASFSARFELDESVPLSISGFYYDPLATAILCRASAIAAAIRLTHGVPVTIHSAFAAISNNDLLTFRQLDRELQDSDLHHISRFAACIGRPSFYGKPVESFERVWMDDCFSPTKSVKEVILWGFGDEQVMILDWDDFEEQQISVDTEDFQSSPEEVREHHPNVKASFRRNTDEVAAIHIFGDWGEWKRSDGWTAECGEEAPSLWPALKLVDFSESCLTSIGPGSFSNCDGLEIFRFGKMLTVLAREAFYNCSSLIEALLPNGLIEMGKYAFAGCSSLEIVKLECELIKLEDGVFCNCTNLIELVLPDDVRVIGNFALQGCTSLKTVNFGTKLRILGECALCNCSSLAEVLLPDSTQKIRSFVFDGCTLLKSVTLPNELKWLGSGTFRDCSSLTEFVLPEGVKRIEDKTFHGCSSLEIVKLGSGVTRIGGFAFAGCSNLVKVVVPDGLEEVGENAFDGCHSMKVVRLEGELIRLEESAFRGCLTLADVVLPPMREFGEGVFWETVSGDISTFRSTSG